MPKHAVLLAYCALAACLLLATVAVAGALLVGMDLETVVETFVFSNLVIGLSAAPFGFLVAKAQPRNPIGWLLLGLGLAPLLSAAAAPLVVAGARAGWPEPALRAAVTVLLFAWGWGVFCCLPLILQLFPTGRPVTPIWIGLCWLTVVTVLVGTVSTGPTPEYGASSYLVSPWWETGESVTGVLAPIVVFSSLASLVVRYRRGDAVVRQQLQWLLVAVLLVLLLNVPSWFSLPTGREILLLLSFALIPASIAVAVLRHGLFDVRVVLSRVIVYGVLTAGVVLAYSALVALLNVVLTSAGAPIVAALAVALVFNPLRLRLQRRVEVAMYGTRRDPIKAASAVGQRLTGDDLTSVLETLREVLRLPYASLVEEGSGPVVSGQRDGEAQSVPLVRGGDVLGRLEVGVRRGERQLSPQDRATLDLLAGPLAVALHARALSRDLQASRDHLLAAATQERQRLHRELHDSLGPVLTGAALKADSAALAAHSDPRRAEQLAAQLADQLRAAIDEVRRLSYGLRPTSLDHLGLVGALRQHESEVGGLTLTVEAPDGLPELPASVEVAAYRIASEALTNVLRHSSARRAVVSVTADERTLKLTVADDGTPVGTWAPGLGMRSMQSRAAEVGGDCAAGPTALGGLVTAVLPLQEEP